MSSTPRLHPSGLILVAPSALLTLLSCATVQRLEDVPRVSHYNFADASGRTWRIDKPVVTERMHSYPEIPLAPGDRILIRAGGCVSIGRSTKVFANARHSSIERLYYPTIWIPGTTVGLEPLRSVLDSPIVLGRVPSTDALRPVLHIGFEDNPDEYGDNGYSSPRLRSKEMNCTVASASQGKPDRGPAWITVEVYPTAGVPSAVQALRFPTSEQIEAKLMEIMSLTTSTQTNLIASSASQRGVNSFDLVVDSLDANGLPENPEWSWAVLLANFGGDKRPDPTKCASFPYSVARRWYGFISLGIHPAGLPVGCTSQGDRLSLDESIGFKNHWCNSTGNPAEFHGHLNWVPATYHGRLRFSDYASDHDIDLDLFTSDSAGETINNEYGRLHIEFDRRETTDHFTAPWWVSFNKSKQFANKALNSDPTGSEAVLVGLLGLDAVHGAHAELHPVYVMAVRTTADARKQEWQIFARNSGKEGECAGNIHYLDLVNDIVRVRLPAPEWGKPGVFKVTGNFFEGARPLSAKEWAVESEDRAAIVLVFRLPTPTLRTVYHGSLIISR